MLVFPKFSEKIKSFAKSAIFIYPLIVIISIPLLLALNTFWNLRSFNRDVNFFIRHQAVGIADTLKPSIEKGLENRDELYILLHTATNANQDILSVSILTEKNNKIDVLATTNNDDANEAIKLKHTQFALGSDQSFAGLIYDPDIRKNVWSVAVPLEIESDNKYLLSLKMKTDTVEEILSRTSKDSITILIILIIITLILLANHFIFYKKALRAQQLAELDRLKDEFISMAAHELRTPITALTGYLELLRDKISPSQLPDLKEDLDTLDSLTSDLHNLIDDLLEVSRIEQNRLKIETGKVQLNEVITKVIKNLTPLALQKNLVIKFTPNPLTEINSDGERLRQVVTNLIGNSIKYTLKGTIEIKAEQKEKMIEVTVSDTGIGIPADQLPKLFGKFHRVKDKQTREVRGTGLGLWITKQIVEMLGGKILAQSIYGTGTSISFTLPVS
ncbi:hypothetical protein A2Z22_01450 [Candidatus Woesebacteria bacterium RBG_16_34_12]|uniref:histidine kinase n=1 Tax=Candidatus Woesebacteria bacterium RBG_16_34_12 TaxID=1802480 RepID=A0A1F7XAR2_9BACT|nr:MAG: hypothetical protein A2Z22_01450 [Candidatus Woesebacteria bacterium RBG_16_34_12]